MTHKEKMTDLYFDNENHIYYWKGEKVPCVSDVCKMIDCLILTDTPPQVLIKASKRGTLVHDITENIEYGIFDDSDKEIFIEHEEIVPYIEAYKLWHTINDSLPIASEESLYSTILDIAGTLDLVKKIGNDLCLIDKKTSANISALRATLQLNLYRLLWNENHEEKITKLIILQLKKDSSYQEFTIPIDEKKTLEWLEKFNEIRRDIKL